MGNAFLESPEGKAFIARTANSFGMSEEDVLESFNDLASKGLAGFADAAVPGVGGMNVLGAPPSGMPDELSNMGAAGAEADKIGIKEEKKDEKKEEKAVAAPASPEDIKGQLKAISDSEETDKGVKKEAEDLSAAIDEARTALDKAIKEATLFATKNAPKPKEEVGGMPAA